MKIWFVFCGDHGEWWTETPQDESVFFCWETSYRILRVNDGSGIYLWCGSEEFLSAFLIVRDDEKRISLALSFCALNLLLWYDQAGFLMDIHDADSLWIPP